MGHNSLVVCTCKYIYVQCLRLARFGREEPLKLLRFDHALLPRGWAENVVVTIDNDGRIAAVDEGQTGGGEHVAGCLLPGVENLHSHAHQRAMAGLAERGRDGADSFWTWRQVMYGFMGRIRPHHLESIAAQAYVEMLKAGYTGVAEFQYLHHDLDGAPYDDAAEMTLRTLAAARNAGIGFTALPALYKYGGFGGREPEPGQKRFLNDAAGIMRIVERLEQEVGGDANSVAGLALHSLRAVNKDLLDEVMESYKGSVHIHIAEQVREVEECLAWSGKRPVEWLFNNVDVDERWCLIHATHMSPAERSMVETFGPVVGLCPTTEANLGDGLFDAVPFLKDGGIFGIGSDSHISISPTEELRWLEYGQRLRHGARSLLGGGRNLFEGAVAGGAQASARKVGRIEPGYRADMVVLDTDHPLLFCRTGDDLLDSWIFSGNANLVRHVFVGGRQVVSDGHHPREEDISELFKQTMRDLAS
jgi:formimidoylglutamate deiminase